MYEKTFQEIEAYLRKCNESLQVAKELNSLTGRKVTLDYPAFLTKPTDGMIVAGTGSLKENGCNLHNVLGQDESSERETIASRVYEFISCDSTGYLRRIYFSPEVVEVEGNIIKVRKGVILDISFHHPRASEVQQTIETLEAVLENP